MKKLTLGWERRVEKSYAETMTWGERRTARAKGSRATNEVKRRERGRGGGETGG